MINQVIIYKEDNGLIAVIYPTPECLKKHTIQEIAIKDVPAGKKFKIVNKTVLPFNVPQQAWEVNDTDLTDGVGGESYEFSKN